MKNAIRNEISLKKKCKIKRERKNLAKIFRNYEVEKFLYERKKRPSYHQQLQELKRGAAAEPPTAAAAAPVVGQKRDYESQSYTNAASLRLLLMVPVCLFCWSFVVFFFLLVSVSGGFLRRRRIFEKLRLQRNRRNNDTPAKRPTNQPTSNNNETAKKLSHLTKQNNNTHTHVHVIHAPIHTHTHRHIKCTNNEYRNPSAFSELLIGKIFTREFYRFCALLQNINYNWKLLLLLLLVGFYLYSLHSKISIAQLCPYVCTCVYVCIFVVVNFPAKKTQKIKQIITNEKTNKQQVQINFNGIC